MRKTSELIWQDAQHQVLFEILEDLGKPDAGVEVLARLHQYTETHFSLEEQYMAVLEYPGLEAHQRAHDSFREEINMLISQEQPPDAQFREIISTYLTEWLKRHVFGIDKELEAFILNSSAR